VHPLGERPILRRHLRDPVEDRLQAIGLLGALPALGPQLGGALLHRGAFLGGEALGLGGGGLLRRHGRRFPSGHVGGAVPAFSDRLGRVGTVALLDS
jgi:hypothetical protein